VAIERRDPKAVVEELFRRLSDGDEGAIDELMAPEMVNHAAPARPGAEGWKQILAIIQVDYSLVRSGRPRVRFQREL
jgi:ketosteroid isomerase-like protein